MISYDIPQDSDTGASSSLHPVRPSPRMQPGNAKGKQPATAQEVAPAPKKKSKGRASQLNTAAEGGAVEEVGAPAVLDGENPSGEEPTNQDAKCFFTTFKSGTAPQHFECSFDMTAARKCKNGKISKMIT